MIKRNLFLLLFTLVLWLVLLAPSAEASKKRQFTLSAAGDCTLASDQAQPASVNFFTKYKQKNASYFLSKVQSIFSKDDMTLVNFEGTLSKRGKRATKKWAFRSSPNYVHILKKGSVEAVSLSNNHSRDYGKISHTDTMKILAKAGISYSTESKPSIRKINGIRIGLVSISSIEVSYDPVAYLTRAMEQIKKKNPDVILVSMHSGIEYTQDIKPIQKRLSHTAIDLGADLVIGHHPHVIQGIEKYKGCYILYSLGNFCFGGNTNPPDKDSYIFSQTFVVKNHKLLAKKNVRVIPCKISNQNNINDYQPNICEGTAKKRIIKRLNNYSKKYGVKIQKTGHLSK